MKTIKKILYSVIALLIASCAGILVCALNPSLTGRLAETVQRLQGGPGTDRGGSDVAGGLLPKDDAGGYQTPDVIPEEVPSGVGGLTGYRPMTSDTREISREEADNLGSVLAPGETGEGISFSAVYYPYYAMLSDTLKAVYCQVYANALQRNATFIPVATVTVEQAKNVVEAVYNDHPELFWLDCEYSCKYLGTGICVELTLEYNEAVDSLATAARNFETCAEAILSGARGLSDDLEKERYVHDALMQIAEYDVSAGMNQSAYSALVRGRSVCAGYSRAFQYLLQQLGIPCYYCTGYAGGDHAWNIVKLGNVYRNVDVTWDDTDPSTYDYYNKSDSDFAATHIRTDLAVRLPACADGPVGVETAAGGGSGSSVDDHINPDPRQPLQWQRPEDPEEYEYEEERSEEDIRRENMEKAGVTEAEVLDTLEEYYADCEKQLKAVGVGDKVFTNVIPGELWDLIERAYSAGSHQKGYVDSALKELKADNFVIQLQVQRLGGGYYRLYHSVYTY